MKKEFGKFLLTEEELINIENMLNDALLVNDKERNKLKYIAPGSYNVHNYSVGKFNVVNFSFENKKLVNYLSNLVNQNPDKITTLHTMHYPQGSGIKAHKDGLATATLVIILYSSVEEGGEFYLNGEVRNDFKDRGDCMFYDGGSNIHEVKEIKKGSRMALVTWWNDNMPSTTII